MERHLKKQELHEFAQWFSFHYGGGIGGGIDKNGYPREYIIDLVDIFIKANTRTFFTDNVGFVKWFAEKYEIYGDKSGTLYQDFSSDDPLLMRRAETTQDWIDQHFKSGAVTSGLLYSYFQDKIKGDLFKPHLFVDLKAELDESGVKIVDENGNKLDTQ